MKLARLLPILALALLAARTAAAQEAPAAPAWSARTLELAGSLPIQDGGRIKPLSTFASFTLLGLNGKRSVTTSGGEQLSAVAWLLDVTFQPETAVTLPVFLVQDADVVGALGLRFEEKKKRDRYSYTELEPGLAKLFQLAHEYDAIEEKQRTSLQAQVVNLARNVSAFAQLGRLESLAILPPADPARLEWSTPAELFARRAAKGQLSAAESAALQQFQSLATHRGDPAAFESSLAELHRAVVSAAESRGEYAKVGLEIAYYKAGLISWSLALFVCGFLAAAALWLRPRNRALYVATCATSLAAVLALAAAIAMRCMIRGRPPVSTLYETVIFVTAVGVSVSLALEWINRRRIAVSAAALLGMIGLFVANGYETLDKKDTMPSLVAVLDTNFWLATHVTAITIGYSAGMLAALLANIYLITKSLGVRRADPSFHRSLAKMVYGVLCFGVIFATVGTILGGIWANESWGRFWGWDPKENGALLIVITEIAILHGRLGGYLREHGLCMAAAFLGSVVAFSWWGVNLLGVGLHSYGFTSGIHTALWSYYGVQWSVIVLGGFAWLHARSQRASGDAASYARSAARSADSAGTSDFRNVPHAPQDPPAPLPNTPEPAAPRVPPNPR